MKPVMKKQQHNTSSMSDTLALCRPGLSALATRSIRNAAVSIAGLLLLAAGASAASFSFSTGQPDGKMATLSRPPSPGKIQTETADDFVVTQAVVISQATFTGLLPSGASVSSV